MALGHEVGDKQGVATAQTNLAYTLYHRAEYTGQSRYLPMLYVSTARWRRPTAQVGHLFAWAGIALAQGRPLQAATLVAAADRLVAPGGAPFDPIDQLDREEIEADIRAALSAGEWQRAQDDGSAMSMEEAVEYALGL